VPGLAERAADVADLMRQKLAAHAAYIVEEGQDLPEIRNWRWPGG
jgi:xylulose-5-phosphate/fructose-6-phosphate phosphoketolase